MKGDTCKQCGKPASVFITEIVDGKKVVKNLCEDCAADEGVIAKVNVPISKLLEDFILSTSEGSREAAESTCDVCGISFSEFREQGVLGCPHDYDAFEPALKILLERAQEGGAQHVGKVPNRAGSAQKRHTAILRLRTELSAV